MCRSLLTAAIVIANSYSLSFLSFSIYLIIFVTNVNCLLGSFFVRLLRGTLKFNKDSVEDNRIDFYNRFIVRVVFSHVERGGKIIKKKTKKLRFIVSIFFSVVIAILIIKLFHTYSHPKK